MRTLKVEYTVTVEPEDIPYVGNCSAIDPETDRTQEEWIRSELASGNELAWCCVIVRAKVDEFEGIDSLGAVSCRNQEELERVFLRDMKANALEDLRKNLTETMTTAVLEARKRADAARRTLRRLPKRVR